MSKGNPSSYFSFSLWLLGVFFFFLEREIFSTQTGPFFPPSQAEDSQPLAIVSSVKSLVWNSVFVLIQAGILGFPLIVWLDSPDFSLLSHLSVSGLRL